MTRSLFLWIVMTALSILAAGCSDDNIGGESGGWNPAAADPDALTLDMYARYTTVDITLPAGSLSDDSYIISSDSEWLKPQSEVLPSDCRLEFFADANSGDFPRDAVITISSQSDPSRSGSLSFHQLCINDYDDNAGDPTADFGLGWGFDAYKHYQDAKSLTLPLLDLNRLRAEGSDSTYNIIQTTTRGYENFDVVSSYSVHEMSRSLTKQQTSMSFFGSKKTTRRYSEITQDVTNSYCGYARLYKVVASHSIDAPAVEDLIRSGRLPFTERFGAVYNGILSASGGSERNNLIEKMLNQYGTHFVLNGDIGGKIDYCVTFDKNKSTNLNVSADEQCKYVFGRMNQNSMTQDTQSQINSSMNANATFEICGGTEATKKALRNAISEFDKNGRLPGDLMSDWLKDISYVNYTTGRMEALELINFQVMPIWQLFPIDIAREILRQVLDRADRSDCDFTDRELGTDLYTIDLTRTDLSPASSSANASLVKVLYLDRVPVMEICSEYVPKIRTDRRIDVFYPIVAGRTNIGQGIFRGDNEGHRPAYLTFSDGDAYVNPVEGKDVGDILDKVYYINGNLYHDDYGIPTNPEAKYRREVRTQQFYFTDGNDTHYYPIVKIGSGYWTRCDIDTSMDFGFYDWDEGYGDWVWCEYLDNGTLYASYFSENEGSFIDINKNFGWEYDKAFKANTRWYLPTSDEVKALNRYLGRNLKAIFKGQPSGYDASFAGAYARYDVNNGGRDLGRYSIRDKNTCSYIAAKDTQTTGALFSVDNNYRLSDLTSVRNWTQNYYPVRMYRTRYYRYDNL